MYGRYICHEVEYIALYMDSSDENIDYYMAFFISYPLSARGHDISPRADRLKG
jgi:hypothetical protein